MKYYLETNATRALSFRLRTASLCVRRSVFTSFLTVFELLAGITNEKEFDERNAVLLNISKSKLVVDWRSFGQIFANAFGVVDDSDSKPLLVKQLANLSTRSHSFEEYLAACRNHRPSLDPSSLGDYKAGVSQQYREALLVASKQLREGYSQLISEASDHLGIEPDRFPGITSPEVQQLSDTDAQDLDELLLNQAAAVTATSTSTSMKPVTAADLLARYDGSLKFHIQASRFVQTENLPSANTPARNSVYDVLHFLYINDKTVMVSDDHLSTKISKALWPNQVISIKNFQDQFLAGH